MLNSTIYFAAGKVRVNLQYMAILWQFKASFSVRLFILYLLQVKKRALANIMQHYKHTVRSYPALNHTKFFKVNPNARTLNWYSADSLPQTTRVNSSKT